jgi:hypothetical protein
MSLQIFDDIEQGSDQWFQARLGIPTASMFGAVMAKGEGKTRRSYLYKLAGECITMEPTEAFTNGWLDRGKVMEAEARDFYHFVQGGELRQVGFILNGDKGCSPDSLIGNDGGLEIKTQRADLLIETILKDQVPSEHMAQLQGNMWVSERQWWDLVVYWPKMPLFVKRVTRDEAYIKLLADEVAKFNADLRALVTRLRAIEPSNPLAA